MDIETNAKSIHKDSTVTLSVYADYIKNHVEETINIIDCAFRN
jgi:hypothetical protein